MDKVIGGEFLINTENYLKTAGNILEGGVPLYSCGRAAFAAILRSIIGKKRILVPDYLCISITKTVLDQGWNYSFYHIDETTLLPQSVFEYTINSYDAILLINYFGIVDISEAVAEIRKIDPSIKIIVDDVQNYYNTNRSSDVDFYFTSLRKWFPVPDGAAVITQNAVQPFNNKNEFAQYKFAGNLLKQYRGEIDDSICLTLIDKGESLLDEKYTCACSEITKKLIPEINFDEIRKKRRANAQVLHEGLNALNVKHLWRDSSTPLFVPIFILDRDRIRNHFFSQNMFMPIHWPKADNNLSGNNAIYKAELSLICDQRYSTEDMEGILEVLKDAMRN